MINTTNNVNLYQPKKITIETKPFTGIDEGMPYQGTQVKVTEEKEGEQKVWAEYALTGTPSKELENIKEVLSSIYAQEAYNQKESNEESNYTPPIGKDGW